MKIVNEECIVLEGGIAVFKGLPIRRNLSCLEKLTAIMGFNKQLGFCRKHKLYFEQCDYDIRCLWSCPVCFQGFLENITTSGG